MGLAYGHCQRRLQTTACLQGLKKISKCKPATKWSFVIKSNEREIIGFHLQSPSPSPSIPTSHPAAPEFSSRKTRGVDPMLFYCWTSVVDAGPALNQHWLNVTCFRPPPPPLSLLVHHSTWPPPRGWFCKLTRLAHHWMSLFWRKPDSFIILTPCEMWPQ